MDSFSIYEDQENKVPLHERGLKNGPNLRQLKNPLQKRTVLSTICVNSSNSIRVQPRRAAKQVGPSNGSNRLY